MKPQRRKQGSALSAYNARHGGVAVLFRKGISARSGPVDTPVRKRLWDSGRWVHAIVTFGNPSKLCTSFLFMAFPMLSLTLRSCNKMSLF